MDGTGNEGRLAVVSYGWNETPPPKSAVYNFESRKITTTTKLANLDEEEITVRPETPGSAPTDSDQEDLSISKNSIKVNYTCR